MFCSAASYASYKPVLFSNDYTNTLLLSYKDQGCRKVFLTGQARLNNMISCVGGDNIASADIPFLPVVL